MVSNVKFETIEYSAKCAGLVRGVGLEEELRRPRLTKMHKP